MRFALFLLEYLHVVILSWHCGMKSQCPGSVSSPEDNLVWLDPSMAKGITFRIATLVFLLENFGRNVPAHLDNHFSSFCIFIPPPSPPSFSLLFIFVMSCFRFPEILAGGQISFFHLNSKDLCSKTIYVSLILRFPHASLFNKNAKKWPVLKNNWK